MAPAASSMWFQPVTGLTFMIIRVETTTVIVRHLLPGGCWSLPQRRPFSDFAAGAQPARGGQLIPV